MLTNDDWVRRFHLEQAGVRGVIARLGPAWREIRGRAEYPDAVAVLLGQSLAATAMFAGEIKMAGSLSVQLKTQGPLRILFTECTGDGRVRGIASWQGRIEQPLDVGAFGGDAMLAITIERSAPQQRHQGIVPLEGHTLAAAFEAYFTRSEQLPTMIHLVCRDQVCAGMMIQQVPSMGGHALRKSSSEFERVGALFGTLTDGELVELSAEKLLRRLFHEDDVRLHGAQALAFGCRCSRERVASVLLTLGHDEALAARSAEGTVEVRCEFCNRNYRFDAVDLAELFARESSMPGTPTSH